MKLDLVTDWGKVRAYIRRAMNASFHVAFATVNEAGEPTVTPIGSLVLNGDPTGLYMERFPRSIPANAEHNRHFCLLAENTRVGAIVKQLRGEGWFGVKLYGLLGERRPATLAEVKRIQARVPFTKLKRFQQMLFGGTVYVRDLTFTRAEAVVLKVDKATRQVTTE
ncbi:MAG: hypothetical protein LBR27_06960 [Bifidobacteriaceae bacterium]|jgi:hypothetical protein|nr:hypothetical protein [Bifidobacteriaceae bacterium]